MLIQALSRDVRGIDAFQERMAGYSRREVFLGRRGATHADHQEVGMIERSESGEIVGVGGILLRDDAVRTAWRQFAIGEFRQRHRSLILGLADHEYHGWLGSHTARCHAQPHERGKECHDCNAT